MPAKRPNGGFYCLAHRERISMGSFSPLLGLAAVRLSPFVIPTDLAAALSKQYARVGTEVQRLARARGLCGLRAAQAFRDRHQDCEVEASNLASSGLGPARVVR